MKTQTVTWKIVLLAMLIARVTSAQDVNVDDIDSLRHALAGAKHDTTRAIILADIAEAYRTDEPDSLLHYADQALQLSRQINYPFGEMRAYFAICYYFHTTFIDIPQALEAGLKAVEIAEKNGFRNFEAACMIRLAQVNSVLGNREESFNYLKKANKLLSTNGDPFFQSVACSGLAGMYLSINKPDSALYMAKLGHDKAASIGNNKMVAQTLKTMGRVYSNRGDYKLAKQYYLEAMRAMETVNEQVFVADGYLSLASLFIRSKQTDSAIYYTKKAYDIGRPRSFKRIVIASGVTLSELLAERDPAEALRYLKIANAARDSVYNTQRLQAAQALLFKEKERRAELAFEKKAYQSTIRQYALLGGVGLLLFVVFNLYRNNKNKQKANEALGKQKETVEKTLGELKSTQAQLIQSEKMASLGELTAGIAHEIQNPLNFVNNFSEVNRELIEELKSEKSKPQSERDVQLENDLLNAIEQNLGKINHHGQRADSIVKGMLLHARTTSGQTEPTDLNSLCDEYLRLAYHGFRAKNKSLSNGNSDVNAQTKPIKIETAFDQSVPKINVVRQEIGRVILNLINNALYAVSQRRTEEQTNGSDYEPAVVVSSKKSGDNVLISVKDNGQGIPDSIKEKIFHPFFTTKPVGQGTGLGLSLAYDIIKAHGGALKVETQVGEGTEFIIELRR